MPAAPHSHLGGGRLAQVGAFLFVPEKAMGELIAWLMRLALSTSRDLAKVERRMIVDAIIFLAIILAWVALFLSILRHHDDEWPALFPYQSTPAD
jgi:hypothetical protein